MIDIEKINFEKSDGLVPAVIQDVDTQKVLMLGYMSRSSLEETLSKGLVTFYSRSKKRLWTKGEESGNHLRLREIKIDCDEDTLLIKATPTGPVCHKGTDTCWKEENKYDGINFLNQLESIIDDRKQHPSSVSYTSKLFERGVNKIAQKVGEEAVELIIEAMDDNIPLFKEEAADLIYHFLILLRSKDISFAEIAEVLEKRHAESK